MQRIGLKSAKHLYQLSVKHLGGARIQIEVTANSGPQAVRLAERVGYEVFDVNMVG